MFSLGKVYDYICNYYYLGILLNRMMSYLNNNAVFIWIPKNAGSSLFKSIRRRGCMLFKDMNRLKNCFPQKGLITFGHMHYFELVERGFINEEFSSSAFKFCFARNPYSRAVSLYFYLKKIDPPRLPKKSTFQSFCYIIEKNKFENIGLYNSKGLSQCNPQIKWIRDKNGNIDIDFIGKVESIEQDMNKLAKKIGLKGKIKLPKTNTTKHKHYIEYYDEETLKIIEKVYREDFEFFGYPFERRLKEKY